MESEDMVVVMVDAENTIERELAAGCTQRQVAQTYALAMRSMQHGEKPDWKRINAAILKRWKPSGLIRIKKMAWSGKCFS